MTTYKVITTLTWKFDSDKSHGECLNYAKAQLDTILDLWPQGKDFDGFCVQVDLARMKERKRLIHLGVFKLDDVFPYVTTEDSKREYSTGGKAYQVRMNSERYHVFKNNPKCVSCGLHGSMMVLDLNPGDQSPHFNMYAEENGRMVLMTKDHKIPKSKGGTEELENFVTCCAICNNLKGAYSLTYEQVKELRELHRNTAKLPRKELRELINKTREEMAGETHALLSS